MKKKLKWAIGPVLFLGGYYLIKWMIQDYHSNCAQMDFIERVRGMSPEEREAFIEPYLSTPSEDGTIMSEETKEKIRKMIKPRE